MPVSSRLIDPEFPVMKLIVSIFNFFFVYKLLKTFADFKYIISATRNFSRLVGFVCKLYTPVWLRRPFFGLFCILYGVKIEEATRDQLEDYVNFTDFFTRTLKEDVRTIDKPLDIFSISSPCDGRVMSFGEVSRTDSTIDCVKGRSYRLDEFMCGVVGDEHDNMSKNEKIALNKNNPGVTGLLDEVYARGNQLNYMVIYLSPGDYHRFHSPAVHTADYRRHVVGYLSPVKPDYVARHPETFAKNERVNIFGEWRGEEKNFFFQSYVGAMNVGSIVLDFDDDVKTNQAFSGRPYRFDRAYSAGQVNPLQKFIKDEASRDKTALHLQESEAGEAITFEKGEMTGRFEMGSTIVMIFESPRDNTSFLIEEGQKVSLGEPIVETEAKAPQQNQIKHL